MNKLANLIDMARELKQKMQKDGQAALNEAFVEFFNAHPEAKAIVWTQYTPHFNDGEACVFGVHAFELKADIAMMAKDVQEVLTDLCEDYDYGYGGACAVSTLESLRPSRASSYNPFVKAGIELRQLSPNESYLVDDFNELERSCHEIREVLQLTFGDHVQVTATRSGFSVTEYEHD